MCNYNNKKLPHLKLKYSAQVWNPNSKSCWIGEGLNWTILIVIYRITQKCTTCWPRVVSFQVLHNLNAIKGRGFHIKILCSCRHTGHSNSTFVHLFIPHCSQFAQRTTNMQLFQVQIQCCVFISQYFTQIAEEIYTDASSMHAFATFYFVWIGL